MANNIRFVDSLKVGAYQTNGGGAGSSIDILNNVDNYVLTATGVSGSIEGNAELVFDSTNLRIGGNPSGEARLEVTHLGSVDDIMLIKNTDNNTGIKVTKEGLFELLEFSSLPSAEEGAFAYSNNDFWLGVGP
mgnify:CR=1 FL=1|jgi:hypothetical protein|tara:strand:+ start:4822 stop:5220 length:399 start_codon:yes stop_codon:yes gene_type:complete